MSTEQLNPQGIEDFINKFRNTVLEPYAVKIFEWYSSIYVPEYDADSIKKDQGQIIQNIKNCNDLVIILRDLRNKEIHWRDKNLTDIPISPVIELEFQKTLLTFISNTGYTVGISSNMEPAINEAIRRKWGEALSWMPLSNDLEYEDNGRFTSESFEAVAKRVEKCFVASSKLLTITNKLLVKGFLRFIKETITPLNNEVYRQVYRCLEFFGWIPPEIQRVHSTTSTRYAKENYIKDKIHQLKEGDINLEALLKDPISSFFDDSDQITSDHELPDSF